MKPKPRKLTDAESAPIPGRTARVSKIDKFGWTLVDDPGVFLEIDKNDLDVDQDYQRQVNGPKVIELASQWSWVACGSLVVADRQGQFYVMDGQHRVMAARKRADISLLPCMVFATTEVETEAKGFLATNANRKPLFAIDKFKAWLAVGDEAAIHVDELIRESERKIGKTSTATTVSCVGLLTRLSRADKPTLTRLWPLVLDLCEGNALHERLVDSLFYIEQRLPNGTSLTQLPWRQKLVKAGYDGLMSALSAASVYYSKGGSKVWAEGILTVLNRGQSKNILVLVKKGTPVGNRAQPFSS